MAETPLLRDHGEPCDHPEDYRFLHGAWWTCTWEDCPGGHPVTATEITEMAYSLWQAEQMDEYHRDIL